MELRLEPGQEILYHLASVCILRQTVKLKNKLVHLMFAGFDPVFQLGHFELVACQGVQQQTTCGFGFRKS